MQKQAGRPPRLYEVVIASLQAVETLLEHKRSMTAKEIAEEAGLSLRLVQRRLLAGARDWSTLSASPRAARRQLENRHRDRMRAETMVRLSDRDAKAARAARDRLGHKVL